MLAVLHLVVSNSELVPDVVRNRQEAINSCDTLQHYLAMKVLHVLTSFENTYYTIFLQLKNRWIK